MVHSHSGTKVYIEQEVPALTRVVNGQREHARTDLVFNLHGSATYLDVSIVAPFSCNPAFVAAASTLPGHTAKRAEKSKFDRYPHINIALFVLETTGRPGPHAMRDADNPPPAIRDTWSAIQSVLHSAISKNNSQVSSRDPWPTFHPAAAPLSFSRLPQCTQCQYRPYRNTYRYIWCQICACHVGLLRRHLLRRRAQHRQHAGTFVC